MMHGFLAASLALVLLSTGDTQTQTAPQTKTATRATDGARTRDVYVSVVDAKGAPATGLTAADFTVREDGVVREVLKAVPATAPLQVVILVDDSQAAERAIQPLREGLPKFIDALAGKADIGIVTVGERPTSLVEHTTDTAVLKKGIGRLFSRPGSGSYLIEAIQDVSRALVKRKADRPVIVAITTEATEFSNQQYKNVLDDLYASGATLHVLDIGATSPSMSDENRNRNQVIAEGTQQTGGRRDQLLDPMSIPERLAQTAGELLNQYVVTYGRPESLIPPEKIQVGVTRPGLTARARTRTGAR